TPWPARPDRREQTAVPAGVSRRAPQRFGAATASAPLAFRLNYHAGHTRVAYAVLRPARNLLPTPGAKAGPVRRHRSTTPGGRGLGTRADHAGYQGRRGSGRGGHTGRRRGAREERPARRGAG